MPKKSRPEYPVIAIECFDWTGVAEQTDIETAKELETLDCWVSGMLIYEDKERVVIAQSHFWGIDNVRDYIAISKKTIRHRIDYK